MRREDGALCVKVSASGLFAAFQRCIKIGWGGRCEWCYVMAGWWQTPAVSLPVWLRRPAWRTTAARAFPAELMASLSLIPQLITSARSSLMKESPHRDETRPERRRRKRDLRKNKSVREWKKKKKKDCIVGTRKQIEKEQKEKWHLENTNGEWKNERQSIKVRTRKNKMLCERKGGEAPGSRWEWGQFENVCDLSVAISLGESYPCSAAL